jgi:hypothetical protein
VQHSGQCVNRTVVTTPSSWDPSGQLELTLRTLVGEHGRRLLSDPVLLASLCADLFDESSRREVNLIVDAAREGVASLLEQQVETVGPNEAVRLTAATFADHRNLAPPPARWAVTQFALALGYQVDPAGSDTADVRGRSSATPSTLPPSPLPSYVPPGAPVPIATLRPSPNPQPAQPTTPSRPHRSPRSRTMFAVAGGMVAVVVIIVAIVLIVGQSNPPPPRTTALAPATVPPVVAECNEQLQFGADGTATPLTCGNGAINVAAWRYYARLGAPVLRLSRGATPGEVARALCNGLRGTTIPIQTAAYHLADIYYGWRFGIDPSSGLSTGACS